jgi:cellulose biosynthesis protein BcsQ
VIDLDPNISLTTQMQVPITGPTIEDVIEGSAELEDALYETPEGILMIPGSRSLYNVEMTSKRLSQVMEPAIGLVDTVIVDTRPALESLATPMEFATKIVIPTYLDGVSMPVTADTIHLSLEAGVATRVTGVLATNVRRPLTRLARDLYASLQMSGVGLECVIWSTTMWPQALASGGLNGYPDLKAAADAVFEEVLSRTSAETALRLYAEAWRKTA